MGGWARTRTRDFFYCRLCFAMNCRVCVCGARVFVRGVRVFVRGVRVCVRGARVCVRGVRVCVRGVRVFVRVFVRGVHARTRRCYSCCERACMYAGM